MASVAVAERQATLPDTCDASYRVVAMPLYPQLLHLLLFTLIVGACATPAPQRRSRIEVHLDTEGADAWLSCLGRGWQAPACEQAAAGSGPGRLARQAEASFGPERPPMPPLPSADRVSELLEALRSWDMAEATGHVLEFLPEIVGGPTTILAVANGHPWGDAYVRRVRKAPEGGELEVADDGEPTVFLNTLLIAGRYTGTPAQQAAKALGVVRHELFHVLFDRYRRASPRWAAARRSDLPEAELAVIVLNEGVAHLVDRVAEFAARGFPLEKGARALQRLGTEAPRLARLGPTSEEARALLRESAQGRYWDKYGAISGMLMAYGIYRTVGSKGIREAVRCGPGRMLGLYDHARTLLPGLPALPEGLRNRWQRFDLCRGDRP